MTTEPAAAPAEYVPTGNTYDKYGTSNPIERRLMAGFLRALDASLPPTPPATIVEVGMGEGNIADRLRARYPHARVFGVDLPDEKFVRDWHERKLDGAFADALRLPFPDACADLVLAIEVLEHVFDPEKMLDEIARIGRGAVVLSVPREPIWRLGNMARGKYLKDLGNTPGHVQHWSARSFVRMVGRRFEVVKVSNPLPWTMAAARVRAPRA